MVAGGARSVPIARQNRIEEKQVPQLDTREFSPVVDRLFGRGYGFHTFRRQNPPRQAQPGRTILQRGCFRNLGELRRRQSCAGRAKSPVGVPTAQKKRSPTDHREKQSLSISRHLGNSLVVIGRGSHSFNLVWGRARNEDVEQTVSRFTSSAGGKDHFE